ncbi:MAG: MFS transporter [Bryobacteraceae bacterium]|nr:MFS transporter [Bryobacteraceae bacterium]
MHRWAIVWLLCLGVLIAYIDRTNLSVALATREFREALQLSDAERGALNSAFFWSYALLQVPAGMVVDRFGVKWPFAIAFFFWSLISGATALATGFASLLGLRVLLGVGEALVLPASLRWIRFHIEENRRGTAVGIFMAGTKFGPAVGAPLSAWLTALYGWQNMFLILAVGGLVWLIPWIAFVKDDDRQLEAAAASAAPALPFSRLLATPVIWGVLLGSFSYNYFVYYNMTWLPAYFVEHRGLSLNSMGVYTMFSFGGMALVAIAAGWTADTLISRGGDPVRIRKLFTCAGLICASTEVIGAMSSSHSVAVFFAVFSMCGLGLATANYWALTQTLFPGAAVGRIAGLQNFAVNSSGVIAPLATGWLKQATGSYEAPMQAIWVILLIGLGSYLFLVRRTRALNVAKSS